MVILNTSPSSLHRDDSGLWVLRGTRGYVSTRGDGVSWQLVMFELPTTRQWNFRRDCLRRGHWGHRHLRLLRFSRLPTVDEADVIRDILGVRKRVEMSEELPAQRKLAGHDRFGGWSITLRAARAGDQF